MQLSLQGCGKVRLLHWNRSDHLIESLRSGIAWKNMPGCEGAAGWARHGEGGSGLPPLFTESQTVAAPSPPGCLFAISSKQTERPKSGIWHRSTGLNGLAQGLNGLAQGLMN